MDFSAVLDVDIITLLVESDGDVVPHIDVPGVRALRPGTVKALLKDRPLLLESNIAGFDEIYGGGATLVKSQVLMRITVTPSAPPVLLAFGSRNPTHFEPGQGTELLSFLGHVIERRFRDWLDLSS